MKENVELAFDINTGRLNAEIEKANHLVELLKEAQQIIDSLSDKGIKDLISLQHIE